MPSLNVIPERLDVIDTRGETTGSAERKLVYELLLSHRIVHVMVVRGQRLFIVRRSWSTRYLPGYYCTSAGGHVSSGESFAQAAARELKEEIGLEGVLTLIETFFFQDTCRVHISLFVLNADESASFHLSPREVLSGRFYSLEEIASLDHSLFHPQLAICIEKTRRYIESPK